MLPMIGAALARMHRVGVSSMAGRPPWIVRCLRRLAGGIASVSFTDSRRSAVGAVLRSVGPVAAAVDDVVAALEACHAGAGGLCLCHNDAQVGNMLRPRCGGALRLIDYDYSDINYAAFDLGNVLCETTFDYSGPHAGGFAFARERCVREYGYAFSVWTAPLHTCAPLCVARPTACRYPDPASEAAFAAAYAAAAGAPADAAAVEALRARTRVAVVASHLIWTLWGLFMEHAVYAPAPSGDVVGGLDYVAYAACRASEFARLRGPLLSGSGAALGALTDL